MLRMNSSTLKFKSDMDLERLPSGKFNTNYLICSLAAVAMNILRLIGQNALLTLVIAEDSPVRHPAKRRRIKTVIQEPDTTRRPHGQTRWTLLFRAEVRWELQVKALL